VVKRSLIYIFFGGSKMIRMMKTSLLLCLLMCTAYATAAITTVFYNTTGDGLWQTAGNWDLGVPTAGTGNIAYVYKAGGVECLINSTTTAIDDSLILGKKSSGGVLMPGKVTMTGGSLTLNGTGTAGLTIGYYAKGEFSLIDGDVYVAGMTRIARYACTYENGGFLNISGGTFSTSTLRFGYEAGTDGLLTLSGGTLAVRTDASGIVFFSGTSAKMDIQSTGLLTWTGSHYNALTAMISAGNIYTSETDGTIQVVYDATNNITKMSVVVPEPTTIAIFGLGFIGLSRRVKRA
jgi:hypothetical protein